MAVQPNQINRYGADMKPKGTKNNATLQQEIDALKAENARLSGKPATPVATTTSLSNPSWVKGYNAVDMVFTAPISSLQLVTTQSRNSAKLLTLDKKFDTVIYLTDDAGNTYYTFGIFPCDPSNGYGMDVDEYMERNKETFFKP